jgi:hypothetical protein
MKSNSYSLIDFRGYTKEPLELKHCANTTLIWVKDCLLFSTYALCA